MEADPSFLQSGREPNLAGVVKFVVVYGCCLSSTISSNPFPQMLTPPLILSGSPGKNRFSIRGRCVFGEPSSELRLESRNFVVQP